jgi:magnesium-transporting ATPase (P-type)
MDVFHEKSERGFRVLAVAYRRVMTPLGHSVASERELTLAGFLTFADHLLEGVSHSIERLRQDGVAVKILTGDNELVTRQICEQVGMRTGRIVSEARSSAWTSPPSVEIAEEAHNLCAVLAGPEAPHRASAQGTRPRGRIPRRWHQRWPIVARRPTSGIRSPRAV